MGVSDVNKIRAATVAARTSADFCHSENAAHGKMSSAIGRKNIVFLTQQKGKLIFDDNGWGSIVTPKTGVPAAGIPVTMAPIPVMPVGVVIAIAIVTAPVGFGFLRKR
jgi:hypothetical protein